MRGAGGSRVLARAEGKTAAARLLPRLLIVEDEDDIREPLARYLARKGFVITAVRTAEKARRVLSEAEFDLLIVDIMLPGESGLSLMEEVRATTDLPVILVTARTETADRIAGLERGADDYVCKPFDAGELAARAKAVLGRVPRTATSATLSEPDAYQFGDWTLDMGTRTLTRGADAPVPMTLAEFRLLHVFVRHPRRVLSRDQLLDLTAGRSADPLDRSIDNQISRLRRRLSCRSDPNALIRTVWGAGYIFSAEVRRL